MASHQISLLRIVLRIPVARAYPDRYGRNDSPFGRERGLQQTAISQSIADG